MVRANGKGKARISKPKRKTVDATSSAATVATTSEPVKTDTDAQALVVVPTAEENKEEIKGEEVKEEEPKETTSQSMKKTKKRNRNKRKTKNGVETATVKDANKPENTDGEKGKKKAETMGMVFMCNSKTKKDCYQYKVLGLPASKKDMVAEIYKGMRLFLFDVDLKLMYGIYKAAGRGGYNLEPKAFKSAFPSQVRFTVLDDCLPLPEEKFKKVIKDNYYGKNKFNCQLNSEQVKNLCKLFLASSAKSKRVGGRTSRREAHAVGERDRSRWPSEDDMRRSPLGRNLAYLEAPRMYEREVFPSPERSRSRWLGHDRHSPPLGVSSLYPEAPRMYEREALRLPERDRSGWRRSLDGVRHSPLGRSSLYLEASSAYEREAYPPPALPPPSRLPPPHPYAPERPLDMDYYRRDALPEHHGHQVFDLEPRRRDITEYREGYSTYRQPPLADPVYSVSPAPRYQLVAPPSQRPLYRY